MRTPHLHRKHACLSTPPPHPPCLEFLTSCESSGSTNLILSDHLTLTERAMERWDFCVISCPHCHLAVPSVINSLVHCLVLSLGSRLRARLLIGRCRRVRTTETAAIREGKRSLFMFVPARDLYRICVMLCALTLFSLANFRDQFRFAHAACNLFSGFSS